MDRKRLLDINSIKNEYVCESDSEWFCLQTLRKLQIDKYLSSKGRDTAKET
jgi:hypothetical protein